MDKLLTIRERPKKTLPEPLHVQSRPTNIEDVALYNDRIVADLRAWIADGKNDAGLITARCGSGATTLVRLLLNHMNINVCEVDHTDSDFPKALKTACLSPSTLILLDGFDSHVGKKERDTLTNEMKGTKKFLCVGHTETRNSRNKFFSKWKKFEFPPPTKRIVFRILKTIAAGRVSDEIIDRISSLNPSDIRSSINTLEMYIIKPGNIVSRDDFVDAIEAIESVFSTSSPFSEKKFEHEPFVISGGVFDNYLQSIQNIQDIVTVSENLSCADIMSTDFTNMSAFGICSVGFPSLIKEKTKIKIRTYGASLSKHSQMLANKKRIAEFNFKRLKQGKSPVSAIDIGLRVTAKTRSSNLF